MMREVLVVQAMLVAATAATYTVLYSPGGILNSPFHGGQQPVVEPRSGELNLPCPSEGAFAYPNDCTRFYKCVLLNVGSSFFVKIHYKCPEDLTFSSEVKACIKDGCHVQSIQQTDDTSETAPPTELPPFNPEPSEPSSGDLEPLGPTLSGEPSDTECSRKYMQHREHSNVYYLCSNPSQRFFCARGTTFDESRQMCTISASVSGLMEQLVNERTSNQNLPCVSEGFFVHPENCSRFYRCVDYAGTGGLFSRFHFECPKDHIFLTGAATCVLGSCEGIPPTLPPLPNISKDPTTYTAPPPTEAPTNFPNTVASESPAPLPETEAPQTEQTPTATDPVLPVTETPEPSAETTLSPYAPSEESSSSPVVPSDSQCPQTYEQHDTYCNIYTVCGDPSLRYVCPQGTAFDEERQMCRIAASDDTICLGKDVFNITYLLLRSEADGGHLLLPQTFTLETPFIISSDTDLIQPPRPVQPSRILTVLNPTSVFSNTVKLTREPISSSSDDVAQPIETVQNSFGPTKNLFVSQRRNPIFSNNVRNPMGHLHFPHLFIADFNQ